MKKILHIFGDNRFTPLLLFILTVLSYGLLLRSIGFYMDDWYIIWFGNKFGVNQYPAFSASDRPLMGYFYLIASTFLGKTVNPLVWQIFSLVLRWFCSFSLWLMLNEIWPKAKANNTWVAMLSVVFPGFIEQWISVGFSPFFFGLSLFFLSVTLMVKAIHDPKRFWLWYIIALLFTAYEISSTEYYYGLELIRVIVLWIVYDNGHSWNKLLHVLKYWAAFLLIFISFLIWRTFFYASAYHPMTVLADLKNHPIGVLITGVRGVYQSVIDAVINAWTQIFNIDSYPSSGLMPWVIIVLILTVFTGLLIFLQSTNNVIGKDADSIKWRREAFWVSLISLIVAIIPFFAAGLSVDYRFPNDRFMLAYIFGSSLIIVALLDILGKGINSFSRIILIALIAAGVGFQFTQGLHFKNVWKQQEALYWQLYWRIPSLDPHTTIMAWNFPNRYYYSQNSITSQLNWTYAGDQDLTSNREIPYEFIFLQSNPLAEIKNLEPNQDFSIEFRTYKFSGNTSKSLLISYDAESCMRVLDKKLTPPKGLLDDYSKEILDASELSDLSLISNSNNVGKPLISIMGSEPKHTWCYFFEKADLERQRGNYSSTITLLDEAQQKGLSPSNESEWFPFIDSYLHIGDLNNANILSQKILISKNEVYKYGMCNIWNNFVLTNKDFENTKIVDNYMQSLGCK